MRAKSAMAALVSGSIAGAFLMPFQAVAASFSEASASRSFTAEDIIRLESVQDAEISPDGHLIVFTKRAGDVMKDRNLLSMWIVSADGGVPRQLVKGEADHPRWSPSSDRIAFLAHDANENRHIEVVSVSTGASMEITHGNPSPDEVTWSPDGRSIAFTAFVPVAPEVLSSPL